ncbi:hypothetical protein [Salinispora pacifica]|uniref:hypothetical protein n=1 Tax=Salinispora pacifica TaxID=351187 RepID=UPI000483041E|nr:hypothetical protein [Salinispora pacifica]
MTGRLLRLHLRARGASAFVAGASAIALLAWAGGTWLAAQPHLGGPAARLPVVVLAPLLAAVLLGPTLAGADEELERGTPLRWPAWRVGHVLLAVLAVATALALTGLRAPETFGAQALARNTLGWIGLVAGATALLGARLAWLPAFGYGCVVYLAAPRDAGVFVALWAWPVQPATAAASWLAAGGVLALGLAGYAYRGSAVGHRLPSRPVTI